MASKDPVKVQGLSGMPNVSDQFNNHFNVQFYNNNSLKSKI